MTDAETLVQRARARCAKLHQVGKATGFCRLCFAEEVERAIAEDHPEMKRGDVFDLVCEWLLTVDDPLH